MRITNLKNVEVGLSAAASAVRATRAAYRDAVLDGDLRAAIQLKQQQLEAEVRLDAARFLVEGKI